MTRRSNALHRRDGFTLVEMSIVLVIVALVVGGVVVGKTLIEQFQIRKVFSEVEGYKAAVNTFREKYGCVPGDCARGFAFFGATCGTNSFGNGGCNGNGDGLVSPNDPTGDCCGERHVTMTVPHESFMLWRQLFLAGLTPKALSGVNGSGPLAQVGVNIPSSDAYPAAGFTAQYMKSVTENPSYTALTAKAGHILVLGRDNPPSDTWYFAQNPVLTPAEAYQVDSKFDDGKPYSGTLTGTWGLGGLGPYPCLTGYGATATYNTTNSAVLCNLLVYRAF